VSEPLPETLPRRRFLRGWRRFALFGGLLVLLLAVGLPWIAGPLAPGFAARAFAGRYQGRLEIGSARLSWFGAQALEGVRLLDPQGQEVAHFDLELSSLWQLARGGGRALGTLRAELGASLVADEQGLTNLERALAPRAPAAESSPSRSTSAAPEPEPEFDLELELTSPLCTWSDARTRAAGKPFEVRGLRAHVALHPGQPARCEAHAQFAGEAAGELDLDAQLDPSGKARARGKVQGFSSGMLDGLAQQHGRLAQVLGPSFDLSFELADLGPSSGTISCALQSERTHFVLEGRVQDGLLRCTEQRGFSLELGEPRAFVASYLEPLLPPGTSMVWGTQSAPWKLECPRLALPLPGAAELAQGGWAGLFSRAELDARLSLPGPIGFENDLTRAAKLRPALDGLACRIEAGPGKPLSATFDARLIAGETGTLHAELHSVDPWSALARGELPVVDGRIDVQDVSNATLDALLGREAFLAVGLGRALDVHVALTQLSLVGGALEAELHSANIDLGLHGKIADGNFVGESDRGIELRFAPPPEWLARQLAPALPAGCKLACAPQPFTAKAINLVFPLRGADLGARIAGAQANIEIGLPGGSWTVADGRALELGASLTRASLGQGGRCALRLDVQLVQPASPRVVLQGDFPALAMLAGGVLPPLSFDLALEQVDTRGLVPWLGGDPNLPALLGPKLDLRVRAEQLGASAGTLELLAHTGKLDARLGLAREKDTWRTSGATTDRVALVLEGADLGREIGPYLPPGTELALGPQAGPLELRVLAFEFSPSADPAQPLLGLRTKLELALPECSVSNELTKRAAIEPRLAAARLQAEVGDQGELALAFDAQIGGAGDARLHAEARGRSLAAGRAALRVEALPCKLVDALLGRPEALSGLLGDTLELEGQLARAPDGSGQLDFKLRAPRGEASASGRLEADAFVLAEPQGLHLRLDPSDAWLAQSLPGLHRAQGAAQPFELRLHSERIALPQGAQTWIAALAGTTARLEAGLPDLVWSEPAGAACELRELALHAELKQAPGSVLQLTGRVGGTPPGDLSFELRALDGLAQLGEEGGPGRMRAALHASAHGMPVGVVDALAGQGGLLVEALGARADLSLESAGLSREEGSFVLDLASPQGPAHLDGELRAGKLLVSKPKGLTAHFSLGPLSSTRIVGHFLPLVCELSKPEGVAPASVEVDALTLPLDGDFAQLDGLLRFDLGEVSYALLPGLQGLFGPQGPPKPVHLPAFTVPIQKGVVHYEKLLVPIGGREFAFHGSYSLVDGSLQLGTEIPLEILGSKVSSELDKARGVIDGKTLVPIEIRGTLSKPRFAVGQGFLDSVVKKALGGALEKGLEGLLKKKKKD